MTKFEWLLEKVERIDSDASDWMQTELVDNPHEYLFVEDTTNLFEAFSWSSTPQGHPYWDDINEQVELTVWDRY